MGEWLTSALSVRPPRCEKLVPRAEAEKAAMAYLGAVSSRTGR